MLRNVIIEAELDITLDYVLVEKKKFQEAIAFMMGKMTAEDKKHLIDNLNFDTTPLKFDV